MGILPSSLPAQDRVSLVVAIPTGHGRRVALHWALGLRLFGLPGEHRFVLRSDYAVDEAREGLARDALAVPGATHILWWDDDIWPPPGAVSLALRHRYPIVSGIYRDRQGRICAGDFYQGRADAFQRPLAGPTAGGVAYVDAAGLGFCLMDLRLFRRLQPPWFRYSPEFSEDFRLFWRIKQELGVRVLLDGDIRLGHEASVVTDSDGRTQPAVFTPGAQTVVR